MTTLTMRNGRSEAYEAGAAACLGLVLFSPFLAVQYDTNGMAEAIALEAGQLFHKNHMLYRPLGLLIFRILQHLGYAGNSLLVLQIIDAICGAIGIGLGYIVFKRITENRIAAAAGCCWLATSLVYWTYSTDAAYIVPAGMFVLAAMACVDNPSGRWLFGAALFTAVSILFWQACIFLVPIFILWLVNGKGRTHWLQRGIAFMGIVLLIVASSYTIAAFASHGRMSPSQLWDWFVTYGEGGKLPMWGAWDRGRLHAASTSALRSIIPVSLGIWPSQISKSTQLGRIGVDLALISLALLSILAVSKAQLHALRFLAGYLLFIPFIVWWDPFEPKWFLIPNLFLAGFLACGLSSWLHRRYAGTLVFGCIVMIGSANFITTIRPRHNDVGADRRTAQCVAEYMQPQDAFIASEWGWPDYLRYVHSHTVINLINETAYAGTKDRMLTAVKGFITATREKGGMVYMADPRDYPQSHLDWLQAQTALTLDELTAFGGVPAFQCSGRILQKLR